MTTALLKTIALIQKNRTSLQKGYTVYQERQENPFKQGDIVCWKEHGWTKTNDPKSLMVVLQVFENPIISVKGDQYARYTLLCGHKKNYASENLEEMETILVEHWRVHLADTFSEDFNETENHQETLHFLFSAASQFSEKTSPFHPGDIITWKSCGWTKGHPKDSAMIVLDILPNTITQTNGEIHKVYDILCGQIKEYPYGNDESLFEMETHLVESWRVKVIQ